MPMIRYKISMEDEILWCPLKESTTDFYQPITKKDTETEFGVKSNVIV